MFSRLYLHIPWCLRKCDYCAFFSAPGSRAQRAETVRLLLREMELVAEQYTGGPLRSIYFGGGTPSLLEPEQTARLLERSRRLWGHQADCEITLEANPGTVCVDSLSGFRQAGITRISLGVQALDDHLLALLGRAHTAQAASDAYAAARKSGFTNIGLDLICGLPGQTAIDWRRQLQSVIELAPEHLSIYSLAIEEGTPFSQRYHHDSPELPDDDLTATLLELTDELLTAAGYDHYEIANYARPGHRSRHNCGYWQRDGYLGLGPSAHSLLLNDWGLRCCNPSDNRQWSASIEAGRLAHQEHEQLTRQQALAESLFLGLRMADGIVPDDCIRRFGADLWTPHGRTLDELLTAGLLERHGSRIALTRRGMLLANQVFMRFV